MLLKMAALKIILVFLAVVTNVSVGVTMAMEEEGMTKSKTAASATSSTPLSYDFSACEKPHGTYKQGVNCDKGRYSSSGACKDCSLGTFMEHINTCDRCRNYTICQGNELKVSDHNSSLTDIKCRCRPWPIDRDYCEAHNCTVLTEPNCTECSVPPKSSEQNSCESWPTFAIVVCCLFGSNVFGSVCVLIYLRIRKCCSCRKNGISGNTAQVAIIIVIVLCCILGLNVIGCICVWIYFHKKKCRFCKKSVPEPEPENASLVQQIPLQDVPEPGSQQENAALNDDVPPPCRRSSI